MNYSQLICPVCRQAFKLEDRVLRCGNGHSFDVAREGYVHLLTGKAPSALQGDSAQMIAARRAFLVRGLYRPLARAVAEVASAGRPRVVADFGCGEGYYLNAVLALSDRDAAGYGTDISKPAIVAAAKRYPEAAYAVADTNKLIPLADSCVDTGLCVFAPRNASEFSRVMRPGGHLIVVIPGAGHLAQVRQRFGLLGIEADKTAKISAQLDEFELVKTRAVRDEIELEAAALRELVTMTPNARHIQPAAWAEIDAVDAMRTDVEFEILDFRRL